MTAPDGSAGPGTEAALRLLTELRAEIARADSKAAVLVAALGMTAGVIGGGLGTRGWAPGELSTAGASLWWTGTAALTVALLGTLMAVLPRYRGATWAPGRPLSYFGDIQQAVRQDWLAQALVDTELAPTASLMAALTENSRIATRKHQWIRGALLAFCVGAVLLPAAPLVG
ncbi:Pycsar system effector family protein [Streptomyces xanthochromogenes]|uniref:Pycsar system effector family protein n=1 Tax=Streptomyces xanthochromogenes TaxID=67384 RepID=UPI00344721B3